MGADGDHKLFAEADAGTNPQCSSLHTLLTRAQWYVLETDEHTLAPTAS